jgi:glycosyltransferase involved in cell wall biosynthesis
MKILWLQQYFGTPAGWGSQRQYEFARRWVGAGHAVDVVCSTAYDPSLAGAGGSVDGIHLHVSRAAYRPQMGFGRRILAFLHFMAEALWHVTRHGKKYDVLVASSGPLTNLIPALWGRWLHGLPYVFEVLDVWPDAAVEAGVLRSRALAWCCRRLESAGYRRAGRIVTCSVGMTARVHAKLSGARGKDLSVCEPYRACLAAGGAGIERVVTIAHGSELGQPDRAACRRQLLAELGWPEDTCVVLYMGALGLSNAVEEVAEAMRLTAGEPRLAWVFAGSGACEGLVKERLARSRGAFLGKVAHGRMREICAAADVNVVSFRREPIFFENSPNKFFDAAAAGVPSVFNRSTWLEPWLKAYGCGIVCPAKDPGREMAGAVLELARDPERRRLMGRGARRLAEEVFDRDKLAGEYLRLLEDVVPRGIR